MEVIIVILLAAVLVFLIVFFIWDRFRQERRWREQGDILSRTVGERIADTTKVFGEVKEGLGELTQKTRVIEEVGRNISSLNEVLRAPKFRGGVGELMLERLLENILPSQNYSMQYHFSNGNIVDAAIHIGDKIVPVDAKFPLEDFERIVAAESDREQGTLRRQFVGTMKKHIDNVAKYILPDEKTFDFALMYIPAENVYYEAILCGRAEAGEIYQYSLDKRVIPVSPNSFYAYLQAIVLGLKGLHYEKAAGDIYAYVSRLQKDLGSFEEDYRTLGGHIRHAAVKYDDADRKLGRFGDRLRLAGETSTEKLPEGSTKASDECD
jgi:DNA recombination protein RmuC